MATPHRTAAGTWEMTVYLGKDADGKRVYKHATADKKADVERICEAAKAGYTPAKRATDKITVGEAVDRYIERRRSTASPSTICKYVSYRNSSFQSIMKLRLCDLTDDVCQEAVDEYAVGHAPKSVLNRWNLIKTSVRFVRKDFDPRVDLPKVRRKFLEMPDIDKLEALLSDIEGRGIEIPVILAMTCGFRRGEIAALDLRNDVDYRSGAIHITKSLVLDEHGRYVLKPPKTEAGVRTVVAPRWVIDKLSAARDDPFYKMYLPNTITCQFKIHADKNKIGCSFHGLRHYFASVMDSLGISTTYQMRQMGHSTDSMLRRYHEYLNATGASVNDKLQEYFENIHPTE